MNSLRDVFFTIISYKSKGRLGQKGVFLRFGEVSKVFFIFVFI